MGGATIHRVGRDPDKLLEYIRKQIKKAVPNLWADSSIILIKPSTGDVRLYEVTYLGRHGENVQIVPIEESKMHGNEMAVTIAKLYGKEPKSDEWVGTVHLHT